MTQLNNQKFSKKGFQFNWGTGIVISFILFCSFVIYVVIRAFQQDVDLVSETYYLDELAYQDRIEEKSNLANSGLNVEVRQTKNEVILNFPDTFRSAKGEVHFYHPSRELFDKRYAITLDSQNSQVVSKEDLIKGNYKIKINWEVDKTPYFQETDIFLR